MDRDKLEHLMDVVFDALIDCGVSIKDIVKACNLEEKDLDYLGLSWLKYYRNH